MSALATLRNMGNSEWYCDTALQDKETAFRLKERGRVVHNPSCPKPEYITIQVSDAMHKLFWTNAQGLQLFAAHWPVSSPRAVIALVHGQGEHIARYDQMARWYNQHEIAVLGFDQQGYGRSEGKRGHAPSLDALLDDIGLLLEKTREQYPDLPLFLYGHSMGGGLCLNYTTRRDPDLTGLIATGPWIRLAFEAP
ncbi:MAG: alpha/beta fold hydrolase, partial [Saprospiraceae bacterium]|nr:alpha/beta fold hydrolase [Saprospiraceae bacterium]